MDIAFLVAAQAALSQLIASPKAYRKNTQLRQSHSTNKAYKMKFPP